MLQVVEPVRLYYWCGPFDVCSQCVKADGTLSDVLPITSGVVQGSVLGPLLFSMFIKDIVAHITSCRVHLDADDVQLYISCVNKVKNLGIVFNQDLTWHNHAAKLCTFSKASSAIRGRLKLALNACARYIYGISRYQHNTEHANKILRCSLDVYYSLRICCTLYRLIGSSRPGFCVNFVVFVVNLLLSDFI
jgi:hypothetical protein